MEKYKSSDEYSYILGISLTIEALKKVPDVIEEVYVSSKAIRNDQFNHLVELTGKYNIPIIEDDKTIEKLSVKENCYGIGIFKKFYRELATNKHIVLYKFLDYGELGTIFRSSVSFNFKDIVLIDTPIDYFDPKTIRASMGSIFHLNIKKYNTFDDYFKDYKFNIYPFISREDKELSSLKLVKPYSLIIPYKYNDLDNIFNNGYYLKHQGFTSMSLSTLSSIVLNYAYQNDGDINNADIKAK